MEDINIVQIPKSDQNHEDCIKVKHEELDTLKYFNTYDKVANTRQFHISTTWVLWKKGDATRACLVAQGYEELEPIQKDLPTVSWDGFCTYLLHPIISGVLKQQISNLLFFKVNPSKEMII